MDARPEDFGMKWLCPAGVPYLGLNSNLICSEYEPACIYGCYLLRAGFLLGLYFDPEIEATYLSETSVDFQRTTRRYISEDKTIQHER
jgi:hypothetical protein